MPQTAKLLPNNNGMAEPPRPRAGLFGPPGRDYECANCDGQLCGWCEREAQP